LAAGPDNAGYRWSSGIARMHCTAAVRALQTYVDEAGNIIAAEEHEPNREPWSFASVSPSIPELYRCCACGHGFREHPGPAVECPRCGHFYAQVEKGVEDRPPEGTTPD
jgi:hypothetical protein